MTSRINLVENTDFLLRAQSTLDQLELILEQTFESLNMDVDIDRSGGVLNIHINQHTNIIINLQSPMQQIWLATPYNGYHYTWDTIQNNWINTRNGLNFYTELAQDLSILINIPIKL